MRRRRRAIDRSSPSFLSAYRADGAGALDRITMDIEARKMF
ncbi:hypothetical protein F0726_00087 [Acidithiobacillus caldus]|nr:hypothetical protein F0726_00087 [Acidithiobacillus caldus]